VLRYGNTPPLGRAVARVIGKESGPVFVKAGEVRESELHPELLRGAHNGVDEPIDFVLFQCVVEEQVTVSDDLDSAIEVDDGQPRGRPCCSWRAVRPCSTPVSALSDRCLAKASVHRVAPVAARHKWHGLKTHLSSRSKDRHDRETPGPANVDTLATHDTVGPAAGGCRGESRGVDETRACGLLRRPFCQHGLRHLV